MSRKYKKVRLLKAKLATHLLLTRKLFYHPLRQSPDIASSQPQGYNSIFSIIMVEIELYTSSLNC